MKLRTSMMAVVFALAAATPALAAPGNNTLYGTDAFGNNLLTIDKVTGAGSVVGNMGNIGGVPALAVDPVTGVMYAATGGGSARLYTVNPSTGAATLVGDVSLGLAAVGDMDFHPNGTLYAAVNLVGGGGTGSDHLVIINPATGESRTLGPFSGVPCNLVCDIDGMEAMAFDHGGTLWAALRAGSGGDQGLYTVNIATGAATFVAPILDNLGAALGTGMVSLHFANDGTLYGGTSKNDGHRLATIQYLPGPNQGRFTYVGAGNAVPSNNSLGALAFERPRLTLERTDFKSHIVGGAPATVKATLKNAAGAPVSGATVTFRVVAGLNVAFAPHDEVTNVDGEATWAYSSSLPSITNTSGFDYIEATDAAGDVSNLVDREWFRSNGFTERCNGIDDNNRNGIDETFLGPGKDCDGNGIPNCWTDDDDGDGVLDAFDNCPCDANADQTDLIGSHIDGGPDGIGDVCGSKFGAAIVNPVAPGELAIDGQFGPLTGEWFGVTPASFASWSRVYTVVDPSNSNIVLLYDISKSDFPLLNNQEGGPVSFQIGGGEQFDVYITQGGSNTLFGPNPANSVGGAGDHVRVLKNGLPFDNSEGCIVGAVDYNRTSPNYPGVFHNIFELKVKLNGLGGGCYSRAPAFWSAQLPAVTPGAPPSAQRFGGPQLDAEPDSIKTVSVSFVEISPSGVTTIRSDTSAVTVVGVTPMPMAFQGRLTAAPNPFAEHTSLQLTLAEKQDVDVTVADISGRLVRHFSQKDLSAGQHSIRWDGKDESGRRVGVGTYFVRVHGASGLKLQKTVVRLR